MVPCKTKSTVLSFLALTRLRAVEVADSLVPRVTAHQDWAASARHRLERLYLQHVRNAAVLHMLYHTLCYRVLYRVQSTEDRVPNTVLSLFEFQGRFGANYDDWGWSI